MIIPRSKLFISGDCLDQLPDALKANPDALCIDLEDGVVEAEKIRSREYVAHFLRNTRLDCQVWVRVNGLSSPHVVSDILALMGAHVDVVSLPKTESASDVVFIEKLLSHIENLEGIGRQIKIVPTIESPKGLRRAYQIGVSTSRVICLQLGAGDLTSTTGIDRLGPGLDFIRASISLAAAEAGLGVLDSTAHGVTDTLVFEQDALRAKSFGFCGKSCMLPQHVLMANKVFTKREFNSDRAV
jgi:citrate lyase subunit beta/citryl-CoA lyase